MSFFRKICFNKCRVYKYNKKVVRIRDYLYSTYYLRIVLDQNMVVWKNQTSNINKQKLIVYYIPIQYIYIVINCNDSVKLTH